MYLLPSKSIEIGVPQGSVDYIYFWLSFVLLLFKMVVLFQLNIVIKHNSDKLSNLLLIIYTIITRLKVHNFSDDSLLYTISKNISYLNKIIPTLIPNFKIC